MDYTTSDAVGNYLLTTISGTFSLQIAEWIGGMSRFMDQYCGRTLVNETPDTFKYDGTGTDTLVIDDVNEITEVTVGGTVVTPYQYPANSTRKYKLVLDSDIFVTGNQNVEVTGTFGYFTALPEDLKFACTVLVAGIVNNANHQDAGVKSEKIGQYQVTYNTEAERADFKRAMTILDTYRKIAF